MTRQQAIDELNVILTKHIDDWVNDNCEEDAWTSLAPIMYCGNNTARLMAKAAMAALEAAADINTFHAGEGTNFAN